MLDKIMGSFKTLKMASSFTVPKLMPRRRAQK
jgi:hypothetical protein